jgi:hypothetical protein
MKPIYKILAISLGLILVAPAFADSPTDAFGTCMVDSLDGKERKNLAKWIFFAIAAHPEIKAYSSATPEDIRSSDEYVGQLITRLLTVDCPNQLKAANASDPLAVQNAFKLVGQVAVQELLTNEDVMKTVTNYAHYADLEKIGKVLNKK